MGVGWQRGPEHERGLPAISISNYHEKSDYDVFSRQIVLGAAPERAAILDAKPSVPCVAIAVKPERDQARSETRKSLTHSVIFMCVF